MIKLVCLYGVGDAYLVCGLVRAFEAHHGYPARIVLKSSQAVIAEMFGVDHEVDTELVEEAERNHDFKCGYENVRSDGSTFYAHPHFLRSGARIDQLTVKMPRTSQADMYRALLGLSPWAPLEIPAGRITIEPPVDIEPGSVLIVERARSWPSPLPEFWDAFEARYGKPVRRLPADWSLANAFGLATISEWVIGPQCGFMSVLMEAGYQCRKTLVSRELDADAGPGPFGMTSAWPYMRAEIFAGNSHPDVDEYLVGTDPTQWDEVIGAILHNHRN